MSLEVASAGSPAAASRRVGPLELSRQLVIGEVLARWARRTPEAVAFVFDGRRVTYRSLNQRVNRLARGLAGLGVGRGEQVAILFHNGLEILECYFALVKLGAVVVPLNFRLTAAELQYQIDQSDSRAVICDQRHRDVIAGIRSALPKVRHLISAAETPLHGFLEYESLFGDNDASEPLAGVSDDDPAFIIYTSGTTGKPKGAVLTHKSLLMVVIGNLLEQAQPPENAQSWLCNAPIFHVGALTGCLIGVFTGGATIITDKFLPEEIPAIVARERIGSLVMTPAMWVFLLEMPDLDRYDMSSLRRAGIGAASSPLELKQRIIERFPGIEFFEAFGQTETSGVVLSLKPADNLRKLGSVGKPLTNVEMRIVDQHGEDVPLGEIGELVFRGATLMQGYYNAPEANAEVFRGGWMWSGDLGRQDEEGFVYIAGRSKDMIISGGENIYPVEIESVIAAHPKVLEVAVIGYPDPTWGESVRAIVVPRAGKSPSADEIVDHCRRYLAGYKKPKSVVFVSELPKNAMNKVVKYRLRETFGR